MTNQINLHTQGWLRYESILYTQPPTHHRTRDGLQLEHSLGEECVRERAKYSKETVSTCTHSLRRCEIC